MKRLDAYIDKYPTSADALFLRAQAHLNLDMPEAAAAEIYDIYGRRVTEPVKGGVYIINGKKVVK